MPKWLETNQDNLHVKFSALSVDFIAASCNPLSSRMAAHVGVKEGYSLISVILPLLACVAWKRLQIDADMLLIITSTSDTPFTGVNVNDLEWPWTPKTVFFGDFWRRGTHRVLRRNGWRWTRTTCEQELLRLLRIWWALLNLLVFSCFMATLC